MYMYAHIYSYLAIDNLGCELFELIVISYLIIRAS